MEQPERAAPGDSLGEVLSRLKTPKVGNSPALQEAAERTSQTGRSLSEMLTALKPPTVPPLVVPDVGNLLDEIDLSNLPEARTARAAEDMVERLEDYQAEVAALVQALQAQADDQRARADRAEGREHKMYRLTQVSVTCTILAVLISLAAVLVPLFA